MTTRVPKRIQEPSMWKKREKASILRGEGGGVQRIVELENGRGRIVRYKFDPLANESVACRRD